MACHADFFRPGVTYVRAQPYPGPEDRARAMFISHAVAPLPRDGRPRAFGFVCDGRLSPWRSTALRRDWFHGWDETAMDTDRGLISGALSAESADA